jgi:hypothetical protein
MKATFQHHHGMCLAVLLIPVCLGLPVLRSQTAKPAGITAPTVQRVDLGEVSIALPAPAKDFVEMGNEKRIQFASKVPVGNRLLLAFVTPTDLQRMTSGKEVRPSSFMMVESRIRSELMAWSDEEFKSIIEGLKKQLGTLDLQNVQGQIAQVLQTLDVQKLPAGEMRSLGEFFEADGAAGFVMLANSKEGTVEIVRAAALCVIRVHGRMLYLYVFSEYKGLETFKWLTATSEQWVKNIVKANEKAPQVPPPTSRECVPSQRGAGVSLLSR